MKSICYVVLPEELATDDDTVQAFVRKHIAGYYRELELPPYKRFFTQEQTLAIAQKRGFHTIPDFEAYLKQHANQDGVENGLYYWITTYNHQAKWDYYVIEGVERCHELKYKNKLPYSVVTPDSIWHSVREFIDSPSTRADFNKAEAVMNWKCFLETHFFTVFGNRNIAILLVHS